MGSEDKRDESDMTFWLIPPILLFSFGFAMLAKFINNGNLADGLISLILLIFGIASLIGIGLFWIGSKIDSLKKALESKKE
ncbi:hypothetical protein IMZ38_06795 [Thermosphaera chiliense]|uniref:Uncharacterized protein n=1 Tax=Thermosphaera chiliense TaxID=3402707 RepID=A0A7M1US86_9CREN|nr:hypothetical protein [Thermosphaera aggregans]QOR94313.1 hypothetical protein IMZ38_06795 [Thermosphaera aggregans]